MSVAKKIRIAARLRPGLQGEVDDGLLKICHASDNSSGSSRARSFVSVANPKDMSSFNNFEFSSCYDQTSTQEEIFENDVLPLVDDIYSGVTVTIFAYGVTSSGKTHTMQGTKSEPGVIPRTIDTLFQRKNTMKDLDITITMSYMEIYKDDVYDLLVERDTAPKLPIRENEAGMVFVANLTSLPIFSPQDFDSAYGQATKQRSVGSTNLNRASSRSHAVLTLVVSMIDNVSNTTLTGKINLVDLAGSENNKLTGNDPSRMAESSAINKSLSVLGQVVRALNTNASRIPYRDSKLTRILQDALGGSSVGLLICNIAPGTKFRSDTINSLNFASAAKKVQNAVIVHEKDNRPPPKSHFAALNVVPKVPLGVLQPIAGSSNAAAGPSRSRASLVPRPRASRVSIYGIAAPPLKENIKGVNHQPRGSMGLSEKEIDDRISKAVEMEVARRLADRERQLQEDEEQRKAQQADQETSGYMTRQKSKSPKKDTSLPAGVLTPLLKRHKDLDDELKSRLLELEKKYERGNKEAQLADVLSPVSKKKTGRAYVALARAHSEKGDLQVALDLYRKAETYVPDNIKLKERIIEIEWAVKTNNPFIPSPKKARKPKTKKSGKGKISHSIQELDDSGALDHGRGPLSDDQMDVDEVAISLGQGVLEMEALAGGTVLDANLILAQTPNRSGRKRTRSHRVQDGDEDVEMESAKRMKDSEGRKAKPSVIPSENEEWEPSLTPQRRTRSQR